MNYKDIKEEMKILILQTVPLYGTGSGSYVRNLAEELNVSDNVAVICPEESEATYPFRVYSLELPFLPMFTSHPIYKSHPYSEITTEELAEIFCLFLYKTITVLKDFPATVVHAQHLGPCSWVALLLKSFYKLPYIITEHGTGVFNLEKDKRFFLLSKKAMEEASSILAVSPWVATQIENVFGKALSEKVQFVPGGVKWSDFQRTTLPAKTNKFNPEAKPVVLYVGRLIKEKGVQYLIEAAPKIDGLIFISGDGAYKAQLKKLAQPYKNIKFFPHFTKEELIDFYYTADVVVVPSIWEEAFGTVVLEAMACGVPVVATKVGGLVNVVKNEYNGLLIKPKDALDLAEKTNLLLENSALRKKMGENARKFVKNYFSWESIVKKVKQIYTEAIERGDS